MLRVLCQRCLVSRGLDRALYAGNSNNRFQNFGFSRERSSVAATAGKSENFEIKNGGKNSPVISIPLRLERRLDQKALRDKTKWAAKQRYAAVSRRGSTTLVISTKRGDLNHYLGQTYSAKEDIPLVSKGWGHRKAAAAEDFFKIHAHGNNLALPDLEDKTTFADLGLKANVVEILEQNGLRQPTLIQATAITKILRGANCIISAETGCGKTLAYLLPIFQQILEIKRARNFKDTINSPLAVVLVPTRELAQQVADVAEKYGKALDIRVKLLQGGHVGAKVRDPSTSHIDLLVSTVSIITELTKVPVYSMRKLKTLILDEADSLTDDSFAHDVLEFIRPFTFVGTSEDRVQICLVSATMPKTIDSVLSEKLDLEKMLALTTPGLHMIMKHVPQTFLRVKKLQKPLKLVELLKKDIASNTSTIVFCNRHDTCKWLSEYLEQNEIACIPLNANILTRERKMHLKSYLGNDVPILVATDIGSRGIDTVQTGHVINYDFPGYAADYVHRCGRTGRVGSKVPGHVTSLIAWPGEARLVQQIERSVRKETSLHRVDANIKKHLNAKYGYGIGQRIAPPDDNDQSEADFNLNQLS